MWEEDAGEGVMEGESAGYLCGRAFGTGPVGEEGEVEEEEEDV